MSPQGNPRAPAGGGLLAAVGGCKGAIRGSSPKCRFAHPMEPPFERGSMGADSGC